MRRNLGRGAAIAIALATVCSVASSAATPQDGTRSLRFLVGTWKCAHTVGDFAGTYTETFAPALGDRWLKQTYEFPATKTEPAVTAEYFLEFDARVPRWVRFGAHSNGQYYGQFSTSAGDAGWVWEYVLPSKGTTSTWTKKSDAEYTIDGPSYPENGKLVTEHHICKKA